MRLRRLRPEASPAEIEADVAKDFETGEFQAIAEAGHPSAPAGTRARDRADPGSAAGRPAAGGSGRRRRRPRAWRPAGADHRRRPLAAAARSRTTAAARRSSSSSAIVVQPAATRQSDAARGAPQGVGEHDQERHDPQRAATSRGGVGGRADAEQPRGLGGDAVRRDELLLLADRVEEAERVRTEADHADRGDGQQPEARRPGRPPGARRRGAGRARGTAARGRPSA